MVISSTENLEATVDQISNYDKMSELKAFGDTKAGVKGHVDAGITKIPQIFILPPINTTDSSDTYETDFIFPVIDLEGIDKMEPIKHKEIEDKFLEKDMEIKKQYYTRDITKKVVHASNFDLYSPSVPATNWRDYIFFKMAPNPPSPEVFPRPCRYMFLI
ncbi:hypothetical protein R3W88_024373 [Solanum pinnatisectum]|uniref:Uncharacterized protein n=1 Tax=Solanum pinnatisectum TaxID=50273 RepID=A0AAV9M362_9SOLN|nr:hypothetical protein R3W88_024373 [Solanum pinnatisectum]